MDLFFVPVVKASFIYRRWHGKTEFFLRFSSLRAFLILFKVLPRCEYVDVFWIRQGFGLAFSVLVGIGYGDLTSSYNRQSGTGDPRVYDEILYVFR